MRWLKRSGRFAAAAAALLWCVAAASAQEISPGYTFVEVKDGKDRPVVGASAAAYNEAGEEVASSVTDATGKARLISKRRGERQRQRFIVRVVKPGYLTYEGVIENSGAQWWHNETIEVKLIPLPRPGSEAGSERRAAPPSRRRRAPPAGPAPPPGARRAHSAGRNVLPLNTPRGHPA
ncbi:MAG TPA: carboxypeptidase-like regulatory domain-containing protein [Pyrinomonadaceae bacterium]|jgi:hypothetical protein